MCSGGKDTQTRVKNVSTYGDEKKIKHNLGKITERSGVPGV